MSANILTKTGELRTIDFTRGEKEVRPMKNYWKALAPIIAGVALLFVPIPEGLKPNAWYYFALFVAVIIALILEPIPAASVGLIGVTAATVSRGSCPNLATRLSGRSQDFRTARSGLFSSLSCSHWVMRRPG
jgi:di/tricarboxylate transporter